MANLSRARLGAIIRARLTSAVNDSDHVPAAVTLGSAGIWSDADSTPDVLRSLGTGALFVEYLIGFHGLAPDDAIFEAASIAAPERRIRTDAAFSEMRATVNHHPPAPPVERTVRPSQHP